MPSGVVPLTLARRSRVPVKAHSAAEKEKRPEARGSFRPYLWRGRARTLP